MSELINPYIAGAPINEANMFFGREDVFNWIKNNLGGQNTDHILVIHGQRRMGKTSILKQLGNHLPAIYIPIFFDVQGRTHTTIDRFLWWMAREIVRTLMHEHNMPVPIPEKDVFIADPDYFENIFMPSLRPFLGEHNLLFTFDEFDILLESGAGEGLAHPLIDHLQQLTKRRDINLIVSISSFGRNLENMQAFSTEFFRLALYKKIGFLSEEQTTQLITRPVEGLLEYESTAVTQIYKLTSGHPYFTQLVCHELIYRCQNARQRYIKQEDIKVVLDDILERGTVNLKFIWDGVSDLEKWLLASLAHIGGPSNEHILANFLHKQEVIFTDQDLHFALLHLREKDVITDENNFVVKLFQQWLRKYCPIEQVRMELVEITPIITQYIEMGTAHQNNNQLDDAIRNFRQALEIDPGNIQARVNIAYAYISQGLLKDAVTEFKKALAIDNANKPAQSGIRRALNDLDELIESMQNTKRVRVFLCHASSDKPVVRDLYNKLRAEGFDPWLDEEQLLPGQDWKKEIAKAVNSSDAVIIFLSKTSINKKGYVQKEIRYALEIADEQPEGTIFLIPLKIEECNVPSELAHWQWVNYFEEKGYERLIRALSKRAEDIGISPELTT